MLRGKAWKFGKNISTDLIAPGRYAYLRSNLLELAKHCLEDARADFVKNVKKGDFIVAGENFGQGSSREHAPVIIKLNGVSAIMAKSIARIFFRNCINIGLPAIICDTDELNEGDELAIELDKGVVKNLTRGINISFTPLPQGMMNILKDGGLLNHIKKNGDFKLK